MMRITVVNPNTSEPLTRTITESARRAAPHGVAIVGVKPTRGVASVESFAEETLAAVGVLEQVSAHDASTDAFVVACFGDTGVAAAREVATGPVVGMTEAALQTACLIANHFVVITMPPRTIAQSERVVRDLGLGHRCAVRAINAPVAALESGSGHLLEAFSAAGSVALDDGAEAVILGCAGLGDLVGPLAAELGVPVIDGVAAAVNIAAGLLTMGVRTSRACTFAAVPGLQGARLA